MTPTRTPEQRREIADRHVGSLTRHSRQLEREGDYRGAQEACDAAADWRFWADYGIERSAFDEQWDGQG